MLHVHVLLTVNSIEYYMHVQGVMQSFESRGRK